MKHHRATRIALMSTLVAAFAAPVLAQQAPTATINESVSTTAATPRPDAPPPGPHAHRPGGPGGPGMHHGPRGDRLLHGIELTEAQKDKVFALRHAAAPEMREAMKASMNARKELRELANGTNFDEARAKQIADAGAAAQSKAAVLRAKTEHDILAVLTPEQRTTLETRRKEAEARWEQRREERREARAERGERGGERRAGTAGAPPAPAPADAPPPAPAAR